MSFRERGLPNPSPEAIKLWLKRVKRSELHDVGWILVNKQFHGLTRSVRPFINEQFETPEEQEAAFDGLTLGLMAMAHFKDLDQLKELFGHLDETTEAEPSGKEPQKDETKKT
jgi:hypothetical protein